MQQHGGGYSAFNTPSVVSHVIANNLCNAKLKATPNQVVVRPDWIIDSIAAGRRLPATSYILAQKLDPRQPMLPAVLQQDPVPSAASDPLLERKRSASPADAAESRKPKRVRIKEPGGELGHGGDDGRDDNDDSGDPVDSRDQGIALQDTEEDEFFGWPPEFDEGDGECEESRGDGSRHDNQSQHRQQLDKQHGKQEEMPQVVTLMGSQPLIHISFLLPLSLSLSFILSHIYGSVEETDAFNCERSKLYGTFLQPLALACALGTSYVTSRPLFSWETCRKFSCLFFSCIFLLFFPPLGGFMKELHVKSLCARTALSQPHNRTEATSWRALLRTLTLTVFLRRLAYAHGHSWPTCPLSWHTRMPR
jgi:hypothetical protein